MAVKISEMTAAAAPTGAELLEAVQSGQNVGLALSQLRDWIEAEIIPQSNTTATTAPTATDDADAGYEPRGLWFDTSANEVYRCLDATVGAAVWVKASLTLDELGSAATADTGDFDPAGRAATAVSDHEGAADPHTQYVQKVSGKGLSTEDYTTAEQDKLAGIAAGATQNATDAALRDRATHTGTQSLATISDAGTAAGKDNGTADDELPTTSQVRQTFEIYAPDPLRRSVESASGGRMTVHYTDKGEPSYFHVVPKFLCEDMVPGGALGTGVFPAFLNGGAEESEIFVGAFQMTDINGEGVSTPMGNPAVSIDWDQSRALCQACGSGFDMATVWDWAAVILWSAANGFAPRGNTNHGRHHDERHETGRRQDNGTPGDSAGVGNILTGSGPNAWRHDHSPAGIADMVGNVWEWLLGMKLVDGRVYLATDNGIGDESAWADTGYDMPSASATAFSTLDNTGAPEAVLRAMLMPNGTHDPEGSVWTNLSGERFPRRGGNRGSAGNAGPSALRLGNTRADAGSSLGSRPRFRNP